LPGETEENHEKAYSGQPVCGNGFEPKTSECEAEVLLVNLRPFMPCKYAYAKNTSQLYFNIDDSSSGTKTHLFVYQTIKVS
jgi:hypothetical protein